MQRFNYSINKELLCRELKDIVVEFAHDKELEQLITTWRLKPYSRLQLSLYKILSKYIPLFDVDALLGMYPLYILSKENWTALVPKEKYNGTLLDIGAGQGYVTSNAKHLFKKITTTETSFFVALRLRLKGFVCMVRDIALHPNLFAPKTFDCVSVLNVIDRSDYPLSLLRNAVTFLKDDGCLIIATPLPIRQAVWTTVSNKPKEILVNHQDGVFEECANDLYENVLKPLGLKVLRVSRLPYVCKDNTMDDISYFDDIVVVCSRL